MSGFPEQTRDDRKLLGAITLVLLAVGSVLLLTIRLDNAGHSRLLSLRARSLDKAGSALAAFFAVPLFLMHLITTTWLQFTHRAGLGGTN